MVASLFILAIASVLGSGILFRHQRYLTLLATSGALFEMWWLVLTLAHRVIFPAMASGVVFLLGSLLFLVVLLPARRHWHWPYWSSQGLWRDVAVAVTVCGVLASAALIQQYNGFIGDAWVAHGFYNGDTLTFITLTQRSLITPGLLTQNPFAGNGPLEYPTLLHAGLADFIGAAGLTERWLLWLPLFVYAQILITIPLFFLFRDTAKNIPGWRTGYRWGWRGIVIEAVVVGYILGLSWEAYVYPQGHFFTTALFVLLLAFVTEGWTIQGKQQYLWSSFAALLAVVLILANAVTGVAALIVWLTFALLRWTDKTRPFSERAGYLVSSVLLLMLFVVQTPGNGGLQYVPQFSYTAAGAMVMLGLPLILLLGSALPQVRHQAFIGSATVALAAVSLITFFFSSRDIIVDNASRFLYHALLVGWPLGVDGLVRGARLLQARLMQLPGLVLRASGVVAVCVCLLLVVFPVVASLMSVHDHLLFKDERVSGTEVQLAMKWITTHTTADDIFLANPNEPWEIPLFTGRSLLRTNYWLSPEDALQETTERAFMGDVTAQQQVIAEANYILLKKNEVDTWNLPINSLVYDAGGIRIYAQ